MKNINEQEFKKELSKKPTIRSNEKMAILEGKFESLIISFGRICEAMKMGKIPKPILIEVINIAYSDSTQKTCKNCGHVEKNERANYCPKCGMRFSRR